SPSTWPTPPSSPSNTAGAAAPSTTRPGRSSTTPPSTACGAIPSSATWSPARRRERSRIGTPLGGLRDAGAPRFCFCYPSARGCVGRIASVTAHVRVAVLVVGLLAGAAGCQQASEAPAAKSKGAPPPAGPPTFVGLATCASCHPREVETYRTSDHARAMQAATGDTVLGDFAWARVTHRGVTSTFFRRDGKFLVRTEGPDGRPGEFEIAYTFGVRPLQQYLIPFPGGRLQALGLAWDTRRREAGGQHWFALYPERLAPGDPLHWTGREQTWN